ncbi:MAG TPA: TetR/AcrR family transcriptional regulator [Actinomycetes bacterium]|nr:TetR/AcrR family transcriptional regulator [Actinomycetes bacterium]
MIGATGHRAERLPGSSPAGIAADAGLTTTALLHHFPSKQQLLVAVLASGTGQRCCTSAQGWGHFGGTPSQVSTVRRSATWRTP